MKIKKPVFLPYLRKRDYPEGIPDCLFFNPGLSEKYADNVPLQNRFQSNFPLQCDAADRLLEEMWQISGEDELLNRFSPISFNKMMDFGKEMKDLAEFAGKAAPVFQGVRPILEHAQKTLVFRWLEEMLKEEISCLEEKLQRQEASLQAILDDDLIEEFSPDERNLSFPENANAWRITAESALFFIPPEYPVFCHGPMAEAVQANIPFSEVSAADFEMPPGKDLLFAVAPAWKALGFNSGNRYKFLITSPEMLNNFLENRYWIVLGNA